MSHTTNSLSNKPKLDRPCGLPTQRGSLVRRSKAALALAAALAGGSMLGACDMRLRGSVINATTDVFFATFLDPVNIFQQLGGVVVDP